MRTGTNHFTGYGAAGRYYQSYNPDLKGEEIRELVSEKVRSGEIAIGAPPKAKLNQLRIDADGRYFIVKLK